MPIKINGKTYYRSLETCKLAGISQATFFRWLREGVIEDTAMKDRRGWRLFTKEDIEIIKREVGRVSR